MLNSWFQQIRFPLQSIQNLQKAIVSQMLALKDNPKDKSIAEHRIYNFTQMIQQKAKDTLNFFKEQSAMRKDEIAIIQGQKGLRTSEKKKPTDMIWQNFYDRSREIKQYYKKVQTNNPTTLSKLDNMQNNVQFFRRIVFMPPYKQPQFSMQQNKGKYVDMHNIYQQYINLCIALQQKQRQKQKQGMKFKLHDYLWFLQNMDKFDDFTLPKKMKYHHRYLSYLRVLSEYLQGFLRRSRPLFDLKGFVENVRNIFQGRYQQGRVHGWDPENDNLHNTSWEFCVYCQKLFTQTSYISHLSGKNHLKNLKKKQDVDMNDQAMIAQMAKKQSQAKQQHLKNHQLRKKQLAFQQFKISKLRQQLANTVYDTMNLVRKKQTRGYQQADQLVDEQQQSQNQDAPIYNPKNLPLGWDGKPIPYWLYKLHGLGIEYKCQICGNYSYWGRRAFQMHFQEWRHTYGMKCLKIPNTIHFKDVTTINDALHLHDKLVRESQEMQFRPDLEEQFEDNQGNILNKRTYTDMKKQGLIDN